MVNLHQVVRGAISAINPEIAVVLQKSAGYNIAPDGRRTPVYDPPVTIQAQVQSLTSRDLRQLESLNIQNSTLAIYMNGVVDGVVRVSRKGGDLITLPDGTVWLTTNVLEQWPTGWCKVSVTLQNGS